MSPGSFNRRVLLAVSGLSPQIITETLYALAVSASDDERFVPTEIEIITTSEGADRIVRDMLAPKTGAFHRLCSDYGLTDIAFTQSRIHAVLDGDGQPLSDIRSAEENTCLADMITERVRMLTADPACALHVSLAGGRKTMSFYAGYALSLFGREQDRLSHVLVNEPFESAPGFWYPPATPEMLEVRRPARSGPAAASGEPLKVSTAKARVGLALIPFVRLRKGLPRGLLEGRQDFAQTVAAADAAIGEPHLTVDLENGLIVADGQCIRLQPAPFGFYVALVSRALKGLEPLTAPLKDVHDTEWAQTVRADLRRVYGQSDMGFPDAMERLLHDSSSGQSVSPMISRLRKQLHSALAPGRAVFYFDDGPGHRNKRYRVPLSGDAISIVRESSSPATGSVRRRRQGPGGSGPRRVGKLAEARAADVLTDTAEHGPSKPKLRNR